MRRALLMLTLVGAVMFVAGCDEKSNTGGSTSVTSGAKPSAPPAPPPPPVPK
jgi:hypothetical protein